MGPRGPARSGQVQSFGSVGDRRGRVKTRAAFYEDPALTWTTMAIYRVVSQFTKGVRATAVKVAFNEYIFIKKRKEEEELTIVVSSCLYV